VEWAKPGIRRHFDFQGEDEKGRKRYIITLQIKNKDSEDKIAVIHLPYKQDGWSIEEPEEDYLDAAIEGLTREEDGERWECTTRPRLDFEGKLRGLFFLCPHATGKWRSYLEPGQTATIEFETLVRSHEPLINQTLTLSYFPDLSWQYNKTSKKWQPLLKQSPYYSSNVELKRGQLA